MTGGGHRKWRLTLKLWAYQLASREGLRKLCDTLNPSLQYVGKLNPVVYLSFRPPDSISSCNLTILPPLKSERSMEPHPSRLYTRSA